MPIEVTCVKCGKTFKVAKLVNWKYSNWCDQCIQDDQPKDTQNPVEARADAKLDAIEADEEVYYANIYRGN